MSKPILYLTYSNSEEEELPNLKEEDNSVYDKLWPRQKEGHYTIYRDSYTNTENIFKFITENKNDIFLFSYSGHAGQDMLLVEDEETRGAGLAALLADCKNLKLVILNGCSTKGQVDLLLEKGIPLVIATSAPINDKSATQFAINFHTALERQANFGDAFEEAIKGVELTVETGADRGRVRRKSLKKEAPLWGIYYQDGGEHHLKTELPTASKIEVSKDFKPNSKLTTILFKSLRPYSELVQALKKGVSINDIRTAIYNSFPSPIGWHLRKLLVPVYSDTETGYDTVSKKRLQQLVLTYETTLELLNYLILSDLWAKKLSNTGLDIPKDIQEAIDLVLKLTKEDRPMFSFQNFLLKLIDFFKKQQFAFFVSEFDPTHKSYPFGSSEFQDACGFMNSLRKKLQTTIPDTEIAALCERGEESLAKVLESVSFLSTYVLATIQDIDVERYPHQSDILFQHKIRKHERGMGQPSEVQYPMKEFLFNRSVLLLKKQIFDDSNGQNDTEQLCLSPLIFDVNAFIPKANLSWLYFFTHYEPNSDTFFYKNVNDPENQALEVKLTKDEAENMDELDDMDAILAMLDEEEEEGSDEATEYSLIANQFKNLKETLCPSL